MRRILAIALFLGIIAISNVGITGADTSLVTLVSTYPERADPLEEVTLNIVITNNTDLMMWNPVISLDLSGDNEDYFTLIDEEVVVEMINQDFLPIGGTVTTTYRLYVNANCPAQKHIIPAHIEYRSGACEGGCQNADIDGQIVLQIYRQDPKVAMSISGPSEVLPGDPMIITAELKNLGTGSALDVQVSATSNPYVVDLETEIMAEIEPYTLNVSDTLYAIISADTMKMEPGFYTFYVYLQYDDKYGNSMFKDDQWELKVIGTPSQEALLQADQLKELGINAYQIKNYTTAISYLERAIELYDRLDKAGDILTCEEYILLSTNYLQASNYFMKGEEFFGSLDYENAKVYFALAMETYEELGNNQKVAESVSRIDTCDEELFKYQTMEYGVYGAISITILYGLISKRKGIYNALKRD